MFRILCFDGLRDTEIVSHLAFVSNVTVNVASNAKTFATAVREADGVIVSGLTYDQQIADALRDRGKDVRWVQFTSSGVDTMVRYGSPNVVNICNAAPAWGPSVAEHGFAMLLSLSRGMHLLERARTARRWAKKDIGDSLIGLQGLTTVIIGCGQIGKAIARRADAFGMRTIGINRTGRQISGIHETLPITQLDAALIQADVIFVCVPLTPETEGLLGNHELRILARRPILINVARGPVINEIALNTALVEGRLLAAGLDVFTEEPLPETSPLWDRENVILSPHISGYGDPNVIRRIAMLCAENAERMVRGEALLSQVDPRHLSSVFEPSA